MTLPYEAEVRGYLADCAAHPGTGRQHHPTGDGAVKLIWHHGSDAAAQIRATFAALTQVPAAGAAPGAGIAGGRQAGLATLMTGDSPDAHTA
jgi:hypothetical protein